MAQGPSTGGSRRDPERIRAEIESTRAEIADSLLQLRSQVGEQLDWKRYVRRQPLLAVGLAFAFGYWIGRR